MHTEAFYRLFARRMSSNTSMFLKDFKIMNGIEFHQIHFLNLLEWIMYYPFVLLIWSITSHWFPAMTSPNYSLRMPSPASGYQSGWAHQQPLSSKGHHQKQEASVFFFYWTQIIIFINLDRHKIWQHWKQKHFSNQTAWTGAEFITHWKGKAVYSSRW